MTANLMNRISRAEYERELDFALAGSFPASDPLPWTFGVAFATENVPRAIPPAPRMAVADVIVGDEGLSHRARAIAEVIGLVMLLPLGILAAGVPIAAAVQALLSVFVK